MFNFKNIVKSEKPSEIKILIDSQPYNPKLSYKEAKEVIIENKEGKVKIANCKISNLKQNEFVDIKKLSVFFNEKLKKLNQEKQNFFIKTTIIIEFFNISEEELDIDELTDYLLSLEAIRKNPERDNSLCFEIKNFQDIDLTDFFEAYNKQKKFNLLSKAEPKSNKLALDEDNLQRLKQINFGSSSQGAKKFKDENGNENIFEPYDFKKYPILNEKPNLNFIENLNFQRNLMPRSNIETAFENVFDFSKDVFIPFEDEKSFNFKYNEKENPNPYKIHEKTEIKKYAKSLHIYGLRPAFNQFGEFITIGKFNVNSHSFCLNINKLVPNKNLFDDKILKKINLTKNHINTNTDLKQNKILDENMSDLQEMSIDESSSKTEDYSNTYNYNKNLIGSCEKGIDSNKTSNYESSLLQEYAIQTICNFQELIKAKLMSLCKDKDFVENINKLNINKNNSASKKDSDNKMVIDGANPEKEESLEVSNPQFLKVLLKNKIDDCLNVEDYSKIMWDYLTRLMKAKDKFAQIYKCDINTEIMINIEKEISSLKLFMTLFLNCFLDLKQLNNLSYINNYSNNPSKNFWMYTFSHTNLLQTQRLRKKKLMDWLIFDNRNSLFIDNQINEKAKKIANLEKKDNQNNLYEIIFYCLINGRISKALELTNKYNLFNLSGLISQFYMNKGIHNVKLFKEHILNKTSDKQNHYLYFIYEFLSIENAQSDANPNKKNELKLFFNENILQVLNWKQFFICNGLYCMKANENIEDLVQNYSEVVNIVGEKYHNINSYLKQNDCQDLNMILLEYYSLIQRNKKYDENFVKKIFLQKNIFSKYSDLHLHFIICTVMLNTLTETYSGKINKNLTNDILILKQIQLKLLNKLREDLLIQGNILAALNLIFISNLTNNHKLALVEDLIFRFIVSDNFGVNISTGNLKIFEYVNTKTTFDSLGLRFFSVFNIEKAIKFFKLSENYEKLHDVINHLKKFYFYLNYLIISK